MLLLFLHLLIQRELHMSSRNSIWNAYPTGSLHFFFPEGFYPDDRMHQHDPSDCLLHDNRKCLWNLQRDYGRENWTEKHLCRTEQGSGDRESTGYAFNQQLPIYTSPSHPNYVRTWYFTSYPCISYLGRLLPGWAKTNKTPKQQQQKKETNTFFEYAFLFKLLS